MNEKIFENWQELYTECDKSSNAILIVDPHTGEILYANSGFTAVTGLGLEELRGAGLDKVIVDQAGDWKTTVAAVAATDTVMVTFWQVLCKDGSNLGVRAGLSVIVFDNQDFLFINIENVKVRQKFTAWQSLLASIFEHSVDPILVLNQQGIIQAANSAVSRITGYSPEELIEQTPKLFYSGKHDAVFYDMMKQHLALTGEWKGDIWNRCKNGEIVPLSLHINTLPDALDGQDAYVAIYRDLRQRLRYEQQLQHLAYHDLLTGLPNRLKFVDVLSSQLDTLTDSEQLAVCFVDLDGFKAVNDTMGHDVGDLLLIEVGKRLSGCIRRNDFVARMGGDEFTVIIYPMLSDAQASCVAERIVESLRNPVQINGQEISVSASVGFSVCPRNGTDVHTLMRKADIAMYQSKDAGRNRSSQYYD